MTGPILHRAILSYILYYICHPSVYYKLHTLLHNLGPTPGGHRKTFGPQLRSWSTPLDPSREVDPTPHKAKMLSQKLLLSYPNPGDLNNTYFGA